MSNEELTEKLTEKAVEKVAAAAAVAALWDDYKTNNTQKVRERLILYYSPLVRFVAKSVAAGLPQNVEQSDLVSYGIFGLIDAIDKFDLERGFKFETYAISRIKGAIIDELRSIDWVPRSVRGKARTVERAFSKLENELKRTPTNVELASEIGITDIELSHTFSQIALTGIVALDEAISGVSGDFSGATVGDNITSTAGPSDFVENTELDEIKYLLSDIIGEMVDRERFVLTLYYYDNLTLAEIGKILGVTESRVCQIHTKAILQLRSCLVEPTNL